ncbi:MAG: calcium:proton antiporter [Chlorobi bacterium]|nr:calcium:proton antiporter [Chlorobiota bacterium]MCI0716386.1 calcium:proton antiporter [Chlorobiota bacterium]
MIKKFAVREAAFLLAILTLIISSVIGNSPFIKQSFPAEAILFFLVFGVIIFAAIGVVHHAELLAYKLGEPFGTMILTLSAVTVEIIMVSVMMLHGDNDTEVARDTIFSTLMILLNGLTGLIMLLGGLKYSEQKYNIKSANSFFSMIFAVIGLGMFLPLILNFEKYYIYEIFLIITCLILYSFFLRMQSKEHNYYFKFEHTKNSGEAIHNPPSKKEISIPYHSVMLAATIASISFLAESLSVFVDDGIEKLHLPAGAAGLIIALIIVSPEGLTAIRAGLSDDMQRVINISLGSMLSTVSLTIPAVLVVGLIIGKDISLGLTPIQSGMVIISLLVAIFSCKDGESNALQGFIHFMLFITFVFLIFI